MADLSRLLILLRLLLAVTLIEQYTAEVNESSNLREDASLAPLPHRIFKY